MDDRDDIFSRDPRVSEPLLSLHNTVNFPAAPIDPQNSATRFIVRVANWLFAQYLSGSVTAYD